MAAKPNIGLLLLLGAGAAAMFFLQQQREQAAADSEIPAMTGPTGDVAASTPATSGIFGASQAPASSPPEPESQPEAPQAAQAAQEAAKAASVPYSPPSLYESVAADLDRINQTAQANYFYPLQVQGGAEVQVNPNFPPEGGATATRAILEYAQAKAEENKAIATLGISEGSERILIRESAPDIGRLNVALSGLQFAVSAKMPDKVQIIFPEGGPRVENAPPPRPPPQSQTMEISRTPEAGGTRIIVSSSRPLGGGAPPRGTSSSSSSTASQQSGSGGRGGGVVLGSSTPASTLASLYARGII